MNDSSSRPDISRFRASTIVSALFVFALWIVKAMELISGNAYYKFGLLPRNLTGVKGIFLAPLIHSDFNHLINNSISIYILLVALVYFYKDLWYKIFFQSWLLSGIMVWIGARQNYHIGCSGLVYALASFIFFSGVFRKNTNLMAVSLLVVFIYGGMIWGVLPIFHKISWEYHLFGGITGMVLSLIYRNEGPLPQKWEWSENDEEEDDVQTYWIEDDVKESGKNEF